MYEIYSKDNCSFCINAKQFLESRNIHYIEYKIDRELTREEFMEQFPEQKKLPLIFENGVKIGGYKELREHLT
jgi:glutaredoxin